MAALAILVAVLLQPAFLLTQPGLPTVETVSGLNVKFDPRTTNLTWDCPENVTVVRCGMVSKEKGTVMKKFKGKTCHCTFPDSVLHGGVTLTVTVQTSQRQISEKVVYTNPGGNGTAARNLSCFIYNTDFMNCTWAKGHAAPDDVQYFLYTRDLKTRRERECRHYMSESGTHVGCHLDFVAELRYQIQVLVNGTSQKEGIQFFDANLSVKKIEIYSPPSNITVGCNASHCLIRWGKPRSHFSTSDWDFKYQLDIRSQNHVQHSDDQKVEVSGDPENKYSFRSPQPRAKHTVQIRAADGRVNQWGTWSQPVEFGSGEQAPSVVHVYVLVMLGTVVCALMLGYLFKRFVGMTPVPQIKDKLNKDDDEIIWEKIPSDPGKGDKEEVLTIEEVRGSTVSV